jgi:hypothetical protein
MLGTLDNLIQNGAGGRMIIILRQLCELSETLDGSATDTMIMLDEIMAGAALDLDPETAAILADACADKAEKFPLVTETLRQMSGKDEPSEDEMVAQDAASADPVAEETIELPVFEIDVPETAAVDLADIAAKAVTEASEDVLDVQLTEPVSRRCAVKADSPKDDIVSLARSASVEDLLRIAELPGLPEPLTNVIVARGERDVIVVALRNDDANFAKSSLTTLVELAASDRLLRDAMIRRPDLPEAIVDRLLPFLPMEDRARAILGGAPFNEEHVSLELSAATAELIAESYEDAPLMGVDTCLSMLEDGSIGIDHLIERLADDARGAELSSVLADRLGVRTMTVYNALMGRLDQASAIVLRAAEANVASIGSVMALRRRCGCRPAREYRGAVHHYESYSVEQAQRIVALMDLVISDGLDSSTIASDVPPGSSDVAIAA